MIKIDVKSLLIGIFACLVMFVLMGFSIVDRFNSGLYQISCIEGGCFILNTGNGITRIIPIEPCDDYDDCIHKINSKANF